MMSSRSILPTPVLTGMEPMCEEDFAVFFNDEYDDDYSDGDGDEEAEEAAPRAEL